MFFRSFLFALIVSLTAASCPPESQYESFFNKCYKYYNTSLPFLAAEKQCNSIGGTLVSIQNAFENSYVSGVASSRSSGSESFWIGANILLSNSWSWTYTNTSFSFTNWAAGEPQALCNACGYQGDADAKWKTTACNVALPFMCAMDPGAVQPESTVIPEPTTTQSPLCPANAKCPNDYTLFRNNCLCYGYDQIPLHWDGANKTCSDDGGMLATIDSAELNAFLVSLLNFDCFGNECPFIGLRCTDGSVESCTWADGSPLTGYMNFESGDPYPYFGNYNYVLDATRGVSRIGGWDYRYTSQIQGSLCQRETL